MRVFFIFCAILFTLPVFTQKINTVEDFFPLKSGGKIPEHFLKLSSELAKEEKKSGKDKRIDKDFLLQTRYFVRELFYSGKVLFNEEVSNYVNKVAKNLLKDELELQEKLKFYVLKSNVVNAFSTDQGAIFVTTGLLGHLENEAELAFVLSHEITHYVKKHARSGYAFENKLKKKSQKQEEEDVKKSVILALSTYSKEHEYEADAEGFEMFKKAGYDKEQAYNALQILLFSDLPFDDIKFDTTYFNTDILYIPSSLFSENINKIVLDENADDKYSSHPNVTNRIANLEKISANSSTSKVYIVSTEQEFKTVRDLSRFETVYIDMVSSNPIRALYEIYLLEKTYPNNSFLTIAKAKILYLIAKYNNENLYSMIAEPPKKVYGESYPLAQFFHTLSKKQTNVLALRYLYDTKKKYPNNRGIAQMYDDILQEMVEKAKIDPEELSDKTYLEAKQNAIKIGNEINYDDSIKKVEASDLSRYQKLKLKRKLLSMKNKMQNSDGVAGDFYQYALSDLVVREKLREKLMEIKKNQKTSNTITFENSKGEHAIENMLIVNPYYASYDKNEEKQITEVEKKQVIFEQFLVTDYRKINMHREILSPKQFTENDVDKYNDLGVLFDWFSEVMLRSDLKTYTLSNEYVQPLIKKYNTTYFMFPGMIRFRSSHKFTVAHLVAALLIVPIPYIIYDVTRVVHNFGVFAIVFDAEKDKSVYQKEYETSLRATNLILQAYVYDILYNLKK